MHGDKMLVLIKNQDQTIFLKILEYISYGLYNFWWESRHMKVSRKKADSAILTNKAKY